MGKSPTRATIVESSGQVRVTIPKPIVDALNIKKGQQVEWKLGRDKKLELALHGKEEEK